MSSVETEFGLAKNIAGRLARVPVPKPILNKGSEIASTIAVNTLNRLPKRFVFRARERYEMAVTATDILKEWRPPSEYEITEWPPKEIDDLPKWLYVNYMKVGKETMELLRCPPDKERKRIIFSGFTTNASVQSLLRDQNQGMIISMIHGADYLLLPFIRDLFGEERTVYAYTEVQPSPINELIVKKLETNRIKPIWVDESVDDKVSKQALKDLRNGAVINTHPDRPPTGDQSVIELDFFGQKAVFPRSSTIGLGRMAPTIPGFVCLTYWGYEGFSGKVIPKMEKETQDYLVQQLVKEYEKLIAQHLVRDGVKRASCFSFMSPLFR